MLDKITITKANAGEEVTFYGIADAHGIESFMSEEEAKPALSMLKMRASLNRQRHAVLFKATMPNYEANAVIGKIMAQDFTGALSYLKERTATGVLPGFENSWSLIPNPKLDPYAIA